jgi:hypothetical protein
MVQMRTKTIFLFNIVSKWAEENPGQLFVHNGELAAAKVDEPLVPKRCFDEILPLLQGHYQTIK